MLCSHIKGDESKGGILYLSASIRKYNSVDKPKWSKLMGHAGWETAGLSIRTFMYFHGIEACRGPAEASTM